MVDVIIVNGKYIVTCKVALFPACAQLLIRNSLVGFHGAWLKLLDSINQGLRSVQLCANTGKEVLHGVLTINAERELMSILGCGYARC